MSLREGMDVERIRGIADEMGESTERLRTIHASGTAGMRRLEGIWEGSDLEAFGDHWSKSSRALETAASALERSRADLMRQADEQDEGSEGDSSQGRGGDDAGVTDEERRQALEAALGNMPSLGGGGDDDDDDGGWGLPNPIDAVSDAWDRGTDAVGDAWDRGTDAVSDVWDWGVDRGRDAVEWGQEATRNGFEWLGDRGAELVDGARDFWDDEVVARWDAGVEAAARLGPSITNFGEQFTQIFTEGRWPRFHEVVASGTLLAGRTAGLVANVATGDDHHIFDSGQGVVESRHELSTTTPDGRGRVPTDLNALMDIQSDTYDNTEGRESDNRHVRVTTVGEGDDAAYIVTVPGTNGLFDFPGSVTGGDEAFDNTSNLELQAGQRSASMEAVMAAMEEANIPPGAPVMLQGHSQGGMVTAELLQDPEFRARYNVTHMITEGSPNDSRAIPDGVQTLAIEHTNDIVPKVDLGDTYAGPPLPIDVPGPLPPVMLPMSPIPNLDPALAGSGDHVTQVRLEPNSGVEPFGVSDDMNAHHYDQYADSVRREIAAGNPAFQQYADDPGLDAFLTDDPDDVHIVEYGTGRE